MSFILRESMFDPYHISLETMTIFANTAYDRSRKLFSVQRSLGRISRESILRTMPIDGRISTSIIEMMIHPPNISLDTMAIIVLIAYGQRSKVSFGLRSYGFISREGMLDTLPNDCRIVTSITETLIDLHHIPVNTIAVIMHAVYARSRQVSLNLRSSGFFSRESILNTLPILAHQ